MTTEQAISFLQDLIQIKSDNDNEEAVAAYLSEVLKAHGIESTLVTYAPGRSSLVAEISNGTGKILGLTGHLDVVSAGDESQWTYTPYSGHIENGVMWGRGTSDMKAGLAAFVLAFINLHESKDFKGTIRLLATVGEEVGEHGSKQLTELGYADDLDALLIAEPCNIAIMYAHKGSLNYKVTATGLAAHSSTPELGKNAIHQLMAAMSDITDRLERESQTKTNSVLGKTFNNITLLNGGIQVNSIPDSASFEANARTVPEFDNAQVIACVQEAIDKLNAEKDYMLTLEVTADQPPVQSDPHSPLIQTITQVVAQYERLSPAYLVEQMSDVLAGTGDTLDKSALEPLLAQEHLVPIPASGTTDAAQFLKGKKDIELAVYGPGIPMLNHKIDERIPLEQYLDFIEVYEQIVKTYMR